MLGSDLFAVFEDGYEVTGWDREDLDITDRDSVLEKVRGFDIVINAAGYTAVDKAEKERDEAFKLNSDAVAYLSEASAILVHFSTDYIFDSEKEHAEDDAPDAEQSVYSASKLAGERNLQGTYYLIRTSWLYGRNGRNFVDTMLSLGNEVRVVNDQISKPTYTLDLARATRDLIEDKPDYGTYHLVNEGIMSWFDFAEKIFELSGKNVKVTPVPTSEFPRPARRPSYSALKNTKRPKMRSVEEALGEYLKNQDTKKQEPNKNQILKL